MDTMELLAKGLKVRITDLFESEFKYVSEGSDKFQKRTSFYQIKCFNI